VTDRTEKRITFWGAMLAAALAAGAIASALIRPVAAAEVRPVDERVQALDSRVTRLEAQREEDRQRQAEMRSDIKEILKAVK
jgi:chaperonin cofactor prefoldin